MPNLPFHSISVVSVNIIQDVYTNIAVPPCPSFLEKEQMPGTAEKKPVRCYDCCKEKWIE
jgi:hypothetical protein